MPNNGRLCNARWQQTYKVNLHCLHSEHARNSENDGPMVSLLLPQKSPIDTIVSTDNNEHAKQEYHENDIQIGKL